MQVPNFDFTNITTERVSNYQFILDDITKTIQEIVDTKDERTFQNTVQPLINVLTRITPQINFYSYIKNLHSDKELRELATKISVEITKFNTDAFLRKDLYEAFNSYYHNKYKTEHLTHEQKRYVEYNIRDFKRDGLHLDQINYEKIKTLSKELSELSSKFQNNVNSENTIFKFKKEELDGAPDYWFNKDKEIIEDNVTYYKVTLKYPDYFPIQDNVNVEETRKKLYFAFNSRCATENTEILKKAIAIRYHMAKILGYKNHADYKTEISMIKTGQNALNFENDMNEKFTPLYKNHTEALLKFATSKSKNPINKTKLDPWDTRYYMREFTESEFDINMNEVRKYFPLDTVKKGLFEIYQKLLSLSFTEIQTNNKWHNDCTLYQVTDNKTNELLGYFYLDLHPREGKFAHAAAFEFIDGHEINKNQREPHVISLICNFPKDGCIGFDDVKTFFHEFGHVMHQICSRPQIKRFVGFGVEWDFVECPSQFLENWVYTKDALQLMSRHTDNNTTIPDDIIDKLIKKKNFLNGIFYKRQIVFALADLKMHTLTESDFGDLTVDYNSSLDLQKLWYDIEKEVIGTDAEYKLYPFASFGHLVGGYDAGYYGYLMSETYAVNLFYKLFKGKNVLDPNIGMHYRKKLLEPGSTRGAMELLRDVLGEEPNNNYFLEEKGI